MNYNIIATKPFEKELKALFKKYPSLKSDLSILKQNLLKTPNTGTYLGNDVYKIRLAIKSKGKGKSGGARIITCFTIIDDVIYLLSIYDKSEMTNISNLQIAKLLKQIKQ